MEPDAYGYTYMASPYSDGNPEVMEARYVEARRACAYLLCERVWVYSPIVHCHDLALAHELPFEFDFWRSYNFAMLGPASFMVVLALPGWGASKGVQAEIAQARKQGKSVSLMEALDDHRYTWGALPCP